MTTRFLPIVSASLLASALAGCAFNQTGIKATDTAVAKTDAMIVEKMAATAPVQEKQYVTRVRGKWLGGKSIPVSNEAPLPAPFYSNWNFNFPGRVNIATAAERITLVTGIPVLVKPDAYMQLSSFVPQSAGAAAATTATTGATGAAGAPGMLLQDGFGSISSYMAQDYNSKMELNFQGSLVDFLNRISSRAALSWEYKDGRIEFFRITTKTFTLRALPGDASLTTSVGKTSSTQGGVTGGEGASSGSSTFNADSTVKTTSVTYIWTAVEAAIKSMLTPVGRLSVNQSTGTITISDTKDVVEAAGKYIEKENLTMNRQVRMRVTVLNVVLSKDYENGVDWNIFYSKLNSLLDPKWVVNIASPASLVSNQAAQLGLTFKGTGSSDHFNGSQAALKALNTFGRASIVRTTMAITTNRQPVPVALTNQKTYIASTTAVSSALGGTGGVPGITPGTVTTGFILNLLPIVNDNGSVQVQFNMDMSELKNLEDKTSGGQTIQIPEVSGMQFQQKAQIRSGETLVLAGYEQRNDSYDKNTMIEGGDSYLSGSIKGRNDREALVLMITPVIEDN